MIRWAQVGCIVLIAVAPALHAGQVLDRVVATVDSRIIAESEWEEAVRVESFLEGRPAAPVADADREVTLQRLIDQTLLQEQMESSGFEHVSADDVSTRLREVQARHPEAQDAQAWHALLARYGLTEAILRERLARQLDLEHYIDRRFRPNVFVDPASIEAYYRDQLVPQLRARNAPVPPLAEVRDRIERLLTEQRVSELVATWLQALRAQTEIEVR